MDLATAKLWANAIQGVITLLLMIAAIIAYGRGHKVDAAYWMAFAAVMSIGANT